MYKSIIKQTSQYAIISLIIFLICAFKSPDSQTKIEIKTTELPVIFKNVLKKINIDKLGKSTCIKEINKIDENVVRVKLTFDLTDSLKQDDWKVNIFSNINPIFNWAPHLTPSDGYVIDQHVFRSPVLIVSDNKNVFYIIPDLEILGKGSPVKWYIDMDAEKNKLTLGMSNTEIPDHVLFKRSSGALYPKGKIEFGFYLMCYNDPEIVENPFRKPLDFLWKKYGHDLYKADNQLSNNLEPYIEHTYNWAFNTWKNSLWQEFLIDGNKVGAPVFIVNVTQSPNYPGVVNEREFRSIWNQAWFSSLRSASGLYRYAKRTNNLDLLEKANLTKELALSFPKKEGFFYGLIGTEMEQVRIDGKDYNRSKGWNHYFWGNSNRNPWTGDAKQAPFHVLDMSWTALLMLRWYDELETDTRLLKYAENYGRALVKKQSSNGFFPGWLDLNTLEPKNSLNESPETSMSVTFLLKLYQLTKNETYKISALKAMKAVIDNIIPVGRWEDFETYWSCSGYGNDFLVGKKVVRNNMFKQCNFSMFWTTEALFECFKLTGQQNYLKLGQRTLDEMLMTQASWQPPYIYVNALGGFGVMNCDGEWNDSRGSLFSEIIIQYGKLLKKEEYKERGIAALKSSFNMMYCPENPKAKKEWEKVWPFFGKEDYGFTMENYGHGGRTSLQGDGMGEFTIYDWGNGAASEAYNRILDKFGKNYLK